MRRLTEEARQDRNAYERLNDRLGCSCHISPPCVICTHPGNPLNQEDDEFWEEVCKTCLGEGSVGQADEGTLAPCPDCGGK